MSDKSYVKFSESGKEFNLYCHSYEEIIEGLNVKILVTDSTGDYQGEMLWLLKHTQDNEYGWLQSSYGSCSGCDQLKACESAEEVDEVQERLFSNIQWVGWSKDSVLTHLKERDWEVERRWYGKKYIKKFLKGCKKFFKDN